MEEKEKTEGSGDSTTLYYGIGAAVLVLLVAGIYLLRPKTAPSQTVSPTSQTSTAGAPLVRPTGPITELACEVQYYNPVIGRKQYYLSAEGADVSAAKTVDCDFRISVAGKVVGETSVKDAPLSNEPSRGGKTFRCSTEAIELEPTIPTLVEVALSDDQKNTATCSATFLFPAP